jgi:arylsulfatase A-like enzyme
MLQQLAIISISLHLGGLLYSLIYDLEFRFIFNFILGACFDYVFLSALTILARVPSKLSFFQKRIFKNLMVLIFTIFNLLSFYVLSIWGRFPDWGMIEFFASQPIQIALHALSTNVSIFFVMLGLTVLLLLLPKQLESISHQRLHRSFLITLLLISLPIIVSERFFFTIFINGERSLSEKSVESFLLGEFKGRTSPILSPLLSMTAETLKQPLTKHRVTYPSQSELTGYEQGLLEANSKRYNVILILVESLRRDQLKLLGSPEIVMPNLEKMAKESVVFSDAYAQASHSDLSDICPMSSLYPLRKFGEYYYSKQATYPRVLIYDSLNLLGYKSAIISSQNEHWSGMLNYLDNDKLDYLFHAENSNEEHRVESFNDAFSNFSRWLGRAGKVDDAVTIDHAIDWIKDNKDHPFFSYINLQSSHFPFAIKENLARVRELNLHFGFTPPEHRAEVKRLYQKSLGYADQQLGRLFSSLRSLGLLEKTIVIVTGDTGQAFYEHGLANHANSVYDEVLRVPLIVKAPQIEPSVLEQPVEHVDIPPTIHALLGIPPHPAYQGANLFSRPSNKPIFFMCDTGLNNSYGIRVKNMKLIDDRTRGWKQLYDLQKDPEERTNLIDSNDTSSKNLGDLLDSWIYEQINYYADTELHSKKFPPQLEY